jgi:hypothetical protein
MACNGPIEEVRILANPTARLTHHKKQIESQHVDNFVGEEMIELAVEEGIAQEQEQEQEQENHEQEQEVFFI